MLSFLLSLAILVGGYFVYGRYVAKTIGVDPQRPTPVNRLADGVDYVALPTWKIFLIQFLNIAGLGPIFGAIMGIAFGPAAFLWIVLGTIFAGAVHDFSAAVISLRHDGESLPETIGRYLGVKVKMTMRGFSLILMILVGAVFVYNPADLLGMMTPESFDKTFWICAIFLYYMAATLLPVDKLIGKIYPLFGLALLFMAAGILTCLLIHGGELPEIWEDFRNHRPDPAATPIFPMMFVSIACGAISGFHATQSPMMARCLKNEKYARPVFYGAMVSEGIVALIWAAAAICFCNGYEGLQDRLAGSSPAIIVNDISTGWMGTVGGVLTVLGVIAAPITSGDTALRSARLIASDFMGISQSKVSKRLMVSVPIFVLCMVVMLLPYEVLWRYFAWCNQMLAVFTLWTITVWLATRNRNYYVALFPALLMTGVCVTYIIFAPEGLNIIYTPLTGERIPYEGAVAAGVAVMMALTAMFVKWQRGLHSQVRAGI